MRHGPVHAARPARTVTSETVTMMTAVAVVRPTFPLPRDVPTAGIRPTLVTAVCHAGGMELTRAALARMIDHTLLSPTAGTAEVAALVEEARRLGTHAVCVSPSRLPLAHPVQGLHVAAVVGFPSGQHTAEIKAAEAIGAVASGADEIDMVIDIGRLLEGDVAYTEKEVRMVREVVPAPVVLKVILETGVLDDARITAACGACERAGADFVKTSTGFHPSGGATVHAVEVMKAAVGDRLGIKASGGIRDYRQAVALVRAGATRLGMSGSRHVLADAPEH